MNRSQDARADRAPRLSRRQVVLGSLAATGSVLAGYGLLHRDGGERAPVDGEVDEQPDTSPSDPFERIRTRWRARVTGGSDGRDDPSFKELLAESDARALRSLEGFDAGAPGFVLWPDLVLGADPFRRSATMRHAYERLQFLAVAYSTPGSALEGERRTWDVLSGGLGWLSDHVYSDGRRTEGNWWDWKIGVPLSLTTTVMLLQPELGARRVAAYMEAVQHFCPEPSGRGANLLWSAEVAVQRAALVGDGPALDRARAAVVGALQPVRTGDGFYSDGSYIQHQHYAYTGGYGLGLVTAAAELLDLLDGEPWGLGGGDVKALVDWVETGLSVWLHNGSVVGAVRGRYIARRSAQDRDEARQVMLAVAQLAGLVSGPSGQRLKRLAKHVLVAGGSVMLDGIDDVESWSRTRAMLAADIEPLRPVPGTRIFPGMDRVLHREAEFTFALAMSSARIATYESINGENLRGWHTGSGMYYLYDADDRQYDDHFWATVDHARLAGTTVPAVGQRPDGWGSGYRSDKHWVGGVAVGQNGVASMAFRTYQGPGEGSLTGKKSWFMFGGEIAFLGAEIMGTTRRPVETVVDNRKLDAAGTRRLTVDGLVIEPGVDPRGFTGARWSHIESGAGPGTGVGVVYGPGQRIRALQETRRGRWSDVNVAQAAQDDTLLEREYATVWIEHDDVRTGSDYSFILLPGYTREETTAYRDSPRIEVIANTPEVQAARRDGALGLTFWAGGRGNVAGVACSGSASVLVVTEGARCTVAVSDPTMLQASPIRLSVDASARRVVSVDQRITVTQLSPSIELMVDLTGARGLGTEVELELAP